MSFIHRWNIAAILFSLILFFCVTNTSSAQETVSFTVSNGAEIRCAADSTVEIIISPNLSDSYTEISLSWGDGDIETILPGESLTRSHTFSTYQFLEECSYNCAPNPLINGFCFNISLIAEYDGITDENASKIITYKIPPIVMFLPDNSVICEGDEICFSNATCPNNDDDMVYTWDFGNGVTTSTADTCIVYPTAGNYSVTLTATNTCGSDTQVQTITVLGLPTAEVSFSATNQDTVACTPHTVNFINESTNGSTYQWQIFQDGSIILDSTAFTTTPLEFTFTEAGVYTVTMTTRSVCGEAIWEQIFIINESPTIIIAEEPPACDSLLFTPDVSYGGGTIDTYNWSFEGGTPATSDEEFPTDILFDTPGIHQVILDVVSPCGIESDTISIEIQSPSVITIDPITAPFCNSPDSILMMAMPIGGIWTGPGIVQDSFFVSSIAGEGMHFLTYTYGSGVCISTDSIEVEVFPLQAVEAGENIALCIEDEIEILQGFTPANGVWSGTGIISNSPPSFDPAVAGAAIHDLTYTFMDSDGCFSFDVIMATVEAMPTFQLPDTILVCNIGGDIDLNSLANAMPSPAGGTVFWDGMGIVDNAAGLFNSGVAGGMGNYVISYSYTTASASACVVVDSLIVNVIEPTEAIAQPDESHCITEGSHFLTATPGGGEWAGHGIVDPATGEIDLVMAGGGEHTYIYTIFAGTSCEMSDSTLIEVVDFAGVNAGEDVTICESEPSIQLTGSDNNTGTWSGFSPIGMDGLVDLMLLDTGLHTFVYTLSSASVANCATSDTLLLTVVGLPEMGFQVDSACVGIETQFTNETLGATAYSWDFGAGTSMLENPVFEFSTFGDFPVTLTAFTENNVCENMLTQTIHISQPPELVAFTPIYQDSCAALDIVLENGSIGENLEFIWYEGDEIISEEDGPIDLTLLTGRADTTYYFRLEVANGCGGDAAIDSVHVAPLPVAFFGTDQNNYCSGEEVDLINVSYGNPISYFWDFGDPSIPTSTNATPPEIFYLADSTVTRTITLITTNECGTDTLSYDIAIHPTEVEAFFNIADSTVCVGENICFTNFSTFNSDLVYDFGDGNTTTDANPCHIYEEPGVYVVELTATACGFDHTIRTITVLPAPELNFDIPPLVCMGEVVTILDSSLNVSNYLWDFGDNTTSSLVAPTHIYDSLDQFNILLTAEASNGCQRSLSMPIEIVGMPQADFMSTDSICAGSPIIFGNNSINSNSCVWDFGDGNSSTDCNPSHIYALGDSTYIASLMVTNAAGCMDTISHLVYIRATPIPDFEFDDNLCSPASIVFTNASQHADSYQWTFSNGVTSSDTHPSVIFETDDIFTVNLLATNDGICTASLEQEVNLYGTPTAAFTSSTPSICAGDELTFNNQSTGNITSQRWTFGIPDGTISFLESPVFTFTEEEIYTIELIVNTDFCSDTTEQIFTVFEAVEATFDTYDLICFEEATGAIDVAVNTGTAPFQYDWSNDAVTQDVSELSAGQYTLNILDDHACSLMMAFEITQPEPITTSLIEEFVVSCFGGNNGGLTISAAGGIPDYSYRWNTGETSPVLSNHPAGNYQVSVTDDNGCVEVADHTIAQNDAISIVDVVTNISCFGFGDGEILIDSITGGSPIFNLTLTGPVNYQSINRRFGELLAGSYQLTLEDAEGCMETYSYEIEEPDSIFVNILQEDTTIVLGEYVDLSCDFNAADPTFSWNPTTGLDCDDCYHPESQPFRDVTYEVTMTDINNCVVQDEVSIKVNQDRAVFVPDAFTPNGDGHNDVFRVRSNAVTSIKQIEEFTVVDRWGNILFQAKDYPLNDISGEWNGEAKEGNEASAGVYVWYAIINFVDGKSITQRGDVTLIR